MKKEVTKHTPGPWKCRIMPYPEENDKHWIDDVSRMPICEVRDYGKEGEANAYLIAAAPDLLEVCKRVIAEYNADWDMPEELIKMARQATARAEERE